MAGKAVRPRYVPATKWVMLGLGGLVLLGVAWWLPSQALLVQGLAGLTAWVSGLGWWGPLAFGVIYIVATMLLVPGGILTITAGALFGVWMGTVIVALAALIGAALGFLLARSLARQRVQQLLQGRPQLGAVYAAIGAGGWKIVALLRLFPPIPYCLQNYLYGLTPIRFCPYLLTSGPTMLPVTWLYVYIGHLAGSTVVGTRQHTLAQWMVLGGGLLASGVVIVYITHLTRQRLQTQTTRGTQLSPD